MSNTPNPATTPVWKRPAVIIGAVVIVAILIGVAYASGILGGSNEQPPATSQPLPTTPPSEPVTPAISIFEPANGAVLDITEPVTVRGEGQGLPEGNVVVQAVDPNGQALAQVATTLSGEDVGIGGKGEWTVELDLREVMPGLKGQILVFGADPKTGQRVAETRIDVTFGEPTEAMIQITEPVQGAVLDITQPVKVAGEAEGLYEGNVTVEAVDEGGAVLARGSTVVESPDAGAGGKGPWSLELDLSGVTPGTRGRIVAFNINPQTGERVAEVGVDVTFGEEMVEGPEPPSTLEGPLWLLTKLGGRAPLEGTMLYVQFEDGKLTGSAGCNDLSGSYTSDAANIEISPLAATRKMCAEPEGVMAQETEFLSLLQSVKTYTTANGVLVMNDANGSPVLTFEPAVVGRLNYLARIALPEDARVTVTIEDVSKADAPATVIGETTMPAPAGPPIPFAVTYNLNDIQPENTYAVRAKITAGDGTLLFTSDTAVHVITRGNPSVVEITLVQP